MKNTQQKLYEKYHKFSGVQKKFLPENNFTHYYSFKAIKKYLKGKNALEIGCGAGSNSFYIAKNGIRTTGLDISEKVIRICKESSKILNIKHLTNFVNADFLQYKTRKKFDLIICYEVIEHIKDDKKSLQKIRSLLKEKGICILSVPSSNSLLFRLGYTKEFDKTAGHLRRYNKQSIINLCKKANLNIIEVIKVEGPVRDAIFLLKPLNQTIKFIKFYLSDIINFIDSIFAKIFGESRIIVVLQK